MASKPLGHFCVVGVTHEGTAKGEMKTIGDVEVYFSYPPNQNNDYGFLLLPDIIGHAFINAQLVADQFAANDYLVVMPDQFQGDAIPLNHPSDFSIPDWLKVPPGHMPNMVDPVVERCLKEMKGLGCKKIGSTGYCFGAKYVVRHLKPGQIDVGYLTHPSFVDAEELEAIDGPLSIAASEIDSMSTVENRCESEGILGKLGQPWQLNLYGGVVHGFATRGDIKRNISTSPRSKRSFRQYIGQGSESFKSFKYEVGFEVI